QATVAIENARLFAESEQRAAELNTVNAVSLQLAGKLDLDALIELVGEQVRKVFNADIAYVALLDRATEMIHFPYMYGETVPSQPTSRWRSPTRACSTKRARRSSSRRPPPRSSR